MQSLLKMLLCTPSGMNLCHQIHVSSQSTSRDHTMATVVKTAWSFVLMQLTRQTDFVYSQLVNGHNVPIPGSERILGPCISVIPMRVILQPGWTVWDLLDHFQIQQARVLPFETSDLRDIVPNSTLWPRSTDYQIVVHHKRIPGVMTL